MWAALESTLVCGAVTLHGAARWLKRVGPPTRNQNQQTIQKTAMDYVKRNQKRIQRAFASMTTGEKLGIVLVLVISLTYIFSMVGYPLLKYGYDWRELVGVWSEWQSFNAAMIAITASVIALYVTQISERKSTERKFMVASVLLPHSLGELSAYFNDSADLYTEALNCIKARKNDHSKLLEAKMPKISDDYKLTFSRCIEYGDAQTAQFLGDLLADMQVHQARMRNVISVLSVERHSMQISVINIVSNVYLLGHLSVMVERLFPFFRRTVPLDTSPFQLSEYGSAYKRFPAGRNFESMEPLQSLTEKNLAARGGQPRSFSAFPRLL
jgi:hypothetical protein